MSTFNLAKYAETAPPEWGVAKAHPITRMETEFVTLSTEFRRRIYAALNNGEVKEALSLFRSYDPLLDAATTCTVLWLEEHG